MQTRGEEKENIAQAGNGDFAPANASVFNPNRATFFFFLFFFLGTVSRNHECH